ncbi:MAG: S8 family peptidase [Nitrospirota bacterium]
MDFVPGEIIVRFSDGIDDHEALSAILNKFQDMNLTNAGQMYPNGPYVLRTRAYRNPSLSTDEAHQQTADAIATLKMEPSVKYAEPNGIRRPHLIPNDPAYSVGLQWDLSMINLPSAWELTTGNSSVIVAVLDTGIRSHADLNANVLNTGYNFVSNTSDPIEPLTALSSFHGTHVAGTIAAIGNNTVGMAGVAWNAKIMPIRVLSPTEGTDTAIINGMLYAAGLPNSSGTVPPQRANVINMSLGGEGACSQSYQDAINAIRNAGVVIVVAAGNDFESGNPVETPASCQGVITVGAVDPLGEKASYSGSQPYVFIAAPGGEMVDAIHAGTLSTWPVSNPGETAYKFEQGTSMAAPHIAGVVALMLSVNPSLTPSEVETILSSTADDLGAAGRDADFGWGLVNAGAAVAAAQGVGLPSIPVPYPSPSLVNFQQLTTATEGYVFVANTGGGTLTLSGGTVEVVDPEDTSWLPAVSATFDDDPTCATLNASFCKVTITVDPTGLPNGEYFGIVQLTSNGGTFVVPFGFQVGPDPPLPAIGPMTVQLLRVDSHGEVSVQSSVTTPVVSQLYNFSFSSVPVGIYVVVAGVDQNGNGVFGDADGEAFTATGADPIVVVAGQTTPVDLGVRNVLDDIVPF